MGFSSGGGSFTGGRYDKDSKLGYQAYGADASMVLWKLTLRGEYAYRRTQLAPNQPYRFELVDDWFRKDGWYAPIYCQECRRRRRVVLISHRRAW